MKTEGDLERELLGMTSMDLEHITQKRAQRKKTILAEREDVKEEAVDHFIRAEELHSKQDFKGMELEVEKAIKISPNFDLPYMCMALVLEKEKRYSEAIAYWKKLTEVRSDDAMIHSQVARVSFPANNLHDVIKYCRKSIELDPSLLNSRDGNRLALALYESGSKDEAMKLLNDIITKHPKNKQALGLLYMFSIYEGNYENALNYIGKKMALDPANDEDLNNLGCIMMELEDLDGAKEAYEGAIKLNPQCPDPFFNLGEVYVEKGIHHEAEINYRKAIEVDPDYVDAYVGLADLLKKQGKLQEAIEEYEKACTAYKKKIKSSNKI